MPWTCPTCKHVFDVGPSVPITPPEAHAEAGELIGWIWDSDPGKPSQKRHYHDGKECPDFADSPYCSTPVPVYLRPAPAAIPEGLRPSRQTRCTCPEPKKDDWHLPACPCYKPPEKGCHVCRCGGSSFCHCSCHKPPERKPLEKLEPPIDFSTTLGLSLNGAAKINALVDRVNDIEERHKGKG